MEQPTRAIWARPDQACTAIATDLPRLAKKFKIYSVTETGASVRLDSSEELLARGASKADHVIHVLAVLLQHVDGDMDRVAKLPEVFADARFEVTSHFFQSLLDNVGGTKCFQILKATNQSAIAPAASIFKMYMMHTYPCRDVQGHWEVGIYLHPDRIEVVQSRREQTMDTAPEVTAFVCRWDLRMVFPRDVSQMERVVFGVTDVTWKGANVDLSPEDEKAREAIRDYLGKIDENTDAPELRAALPPRRPREPVQEPKQEKAACCSLQ
jgi:hypothetical protein